MTNLFYNCPIEAAYMAKNFGVEITIPTMEADQYTNSKCLAWESIARGPYSLKYYIHPDSLHIFTPQKGDFGSAKDDLGFHGFQVKDWGQKTTNEYFKRLVAEGKIHIIQRNNLPFIMPEVEA